MGPTRRCPIGSPVVIPAEDAAAEPDLRSYLNVLNRRKWVVGLVTVLCVAAALGFSLLQTNKYTATAEVLLQPAGSSNALNSAAQADLTPTDIQTAIQIMTSAPVQAAVTRKLGSPAPKVTVSEVGQTNVVDIAYTDPSPTRAARVANDYGQAYVTYEQTQVVDNMLAAASQIQTRINSLNQQIATLEAAGSSPSSPQVQDILTQQASFKDQLAQLQVNTALANGGAQVVTPAVAPTSPSSPRPKRDAAIAVAVGLILGVGIAFLLEYLDDSIRHQDDLRRLVPDLPVLVAVPNVGEWKNAKSTYLVTRKAPKSPASEAYRSLRTSLQFMALDRPMRLLQITSPLPGEGKTTTLANLAVMMAETGDRVLVVCCDLRRPRLYQFFGLDNQVGLTSVLLGQATLDQAIQPVPDLPNLSVLAPGVVPPNPSELLVSDRTAELFQ
ncbi:MAG: Wzz/FepE/Etk N-terminal domain-containing protein, partial [Acidimicrobiales bacterium]